MSCNNSRAVGGSTFRANALGRRIGCPDALDRCAIAVPDEDVASTTANACFRRRYETEFLNGFLANPSDGVYTELGVGPTTTVRISRVQREGYFVGQAFSVATRRLEGVFGKLDDRGISGISVTCLRSTSLSGEVQRLTTPTALLVYTPDHVVVVGSGGTRDGDVLPCIANVYRSYDAGCGFTFKVFVAVGGGLSAATPELTDVSYQDIQVDPYNYRSWLLCGSAVIVDGSVLRRRCAIIWRVSADTFTPIPLPSTEGHPARMYAAIDLTGTGIADKVTQAVSIATSGDLVTVGVNVYNGAVTAVGLGVCVWPLRHTLTQLLPWSATAYNDVHTGMLRVTSTTSTACLRVLVPDGGGFGTDCGGSNPGLYVVLLARMDTTAGFPSHAVQVQAFSRDTSPSLAFGVAGTCTWTAPTTGSTRPNDAYLAPNARDVLVVGNSFFAETKELLLSHTYVVPGFPDLTVHATPESVPLPFVVRVSSLGCPCALVTDLPGCSALRWASGVAETGVNAITVLGDVNDQLTAPSQCADVLTAVVYLGARSAPRVMNCGSDDASSRAPLLQTRGCGIVALQRACEACVCSSSSSETCTPLCATSTTLLLPGPLVIGAGTPTTALPLAGTICFDAETGTFKGYNGTAWVTFRIR